MQWWRAIHDGSDDPVVPPPFHPHPDEGTR
jgi:hypothetical protein